MLYSNSSARQLFAEGRKLEGDSFARYLERAPRAAARKPSSAAATRCSRSRSAGEPQVYHVSQRSFLLNAVPHRLLLLKQLTREINSQEVRDLEEGDPRDRPRAEQFARADFLAGAFRADPARTRRPTRSSCMPVFSTIEDRARHLAGFIEGYAQFAKLPQPRLAPVAWEVLIERLRAVVVVSARGLAAETRGELRHRADRAGVDQPPQERARIRRRPGIHRARRQPRSRRASASKYAIAARAFTGPALENALVPFYSTKESGTGLGLTLCREIVEAHGGRLRIANRAGGGAVDHALAAGR